MTSTEGPVTGVDTTEAEATEADATGVDITRAVADAVLYEGYVLYPYRASAAKNQARWQWGVLMPSDVVDVDRSERMGNRTDVVVDGSNPVLDATVRFLQVQRRGVERVTDDGFVSADRLDVGDTTYVGWDEACEHEVHVRIPVGDPLEVRVDVPGGRGQETLVDPDGQMVGRLVRTREPLRIGVAAQTRSPRSPYPVSIVTVQVENRTQPVDDPGDRRQAWLHRALVACHVVLEVQGARFVSHLDPPEWATGLVAECHNDGVFPVLGGGEADANVMLSSPIILYDHPQLAPQSQTDFHDGLEIDELLSLRTMTLSDKEKREVRGTDPRAAELLRSVDDMPPDLWERLHGTVRYLDAMTGSDPERMTSPAGPPVDAPWWDPGSDTSVDPEHDSVQIGAVEVRRGTRVVLRPGVRRADAYDLFLAGRTATVAAVLLDVDDKRHLAVTVDEDPGSELKSSHGRYLYFAPDEVEPLQESSGSSERGR